MRISDWSSDVCSSDLMDNGRLTDHHGKTVDFRNVVLIMTTNAGASDMARQGIGFGDISKEDAGDEAVKLMFTQIGRASCRAQLCQDVSISVVAVTLKKKQYKKKQ